MTEQEIINSQVFKLINHQIDEKAEYVRRVLPWLKEEMNRLFDSNEGRYKSYLRTRTYEEGEMEVDLPVSLPDLQRLAARIEEIIQTEKQISELQRWKLRLLNDYDFTKGDDTLQKKIFG